MKLIVGLGNPGKKYELTRHNVGFLVLDYLSREWKVPLTKIKFKSYYGEIRIGDEKVILLKPQTYMNLSGEAVAAAIRYFDVAMEDVLVIYDDIDVDFGKLRIRKQGSGGSHNGMRNIIYLMQEDTFPRLRIGIGRDERLPLRDFVLQTFPASDHDTLREVVVRASEAVECFIRNGIDQTMNRYNG